MKNNCNNCCHNKKLTKNDYSQNGCIHTDYDGFACDVFGCEGQICHMVGLDPETGVCEEFTPRLPR